MLDASKLDASFDGILTPKNLAQDAQKKAFTFENAGRATHMPAKKIEESIETVVEESASNRQTLVSN